MLPFRIRMPGLRPALQTSVLRCGTATASSFADAPESQEAMRERARKRDSRKRAQRKESFEAACEKANVPSFKNSLEKASAWPLTATKLATLQVSRSPHKVFLAQSPSDLGKLCNLACSHCHVEAGPTRTEAMSTKTADRVLELLAGAPHILTLDLTGGSPELHSAFRQLVEGARKLRPRSDDLEIIDRCNLTVFEQPGQEKTPEYLAAKQLTVVASLPCYGPVNVDLQRGKGVFESSVRGLRRLNALGFGAAEGRCSDGSPPLRLHLVYNPVGPTLPGGQASLEAAYRKELAQTVGVKFDKLYCITNMPIKRFADQLLQEGSYVSYLQLLAGAFNTSTVSGLMCRTGISVDWDGRLSDCDFNQQLELPLMGIRAPKSVWDIKSLQELDNRRVLTDRHCFACTAGEGSSCGGAISLEK